MAGNSAIETGTGRKLAAALLFTFGTAATAGTVLGFFGDTWWGFDRLADWRFPYIVVLVATAIIYGFVYRRALSAVFLLAAVVNGVLLAPMWLAAQPAVASNDRIRVVTFDTSGSNVHRPEVIEWINTEEADVALLHRASGDWAGALDLTGAPYRIVPTTDGADGTAAPLVLVRHNATVSPMPSVPGSNVTLRVANKTGTATIIGLAVATPGSAYQTDERSTRFAAVNAAALAMDGPVVVTGNLETSRWSKAFAVIAEGMTNSEDGFGYTATWPSYDWPFVGSYTGLPLDHAIYRGGITVPSRQAGPDLGASHRPLLFDISPASS